MERHARIRCRRWIERGRLHLERGTSADLGAFTDGRFDGVVAVHVVHFWDEPERDLREIRRVLRPGGRLVLGFVPEGVAWDAVERWLRQSGFAQVQSVVEEDLVWTRGVR
jgi:SAM-dependent methyltransferase